MKFPKNLIEAGDKQISIENRVKLLIEKGNDIVDEFIAIAYIAGLERAKEINAMKFEGTFNEMVDKEIKQIKQNLM